MSRDVPRQRAAQLRWMQARRARWLAANGPCRVCGTWDDLQVDHIDPATKLGHNVWSWAPERMAAELAKCQVLCATHHREKTSDEQRGELSPTAKLTDADVWQILGATARREPQGDIAARFGISRREVYRIVRGERWAHIHWAFHAWQAVA